MHYGLNSWHIWHKLKNEGKKCPLSQEALGTDKAKRFSCRQENAGESARDELVRKYPLPVDTPKSSHSGQPHCRWYSQQNTVPKRHYWLSRLQSAAPLTVLTHAGPSRFLPETGDGQTNHQERFVSEMWHSGSKGRHLSAAAEDKFLDSFRYKQGIQVDFTL